MTRITFGGCLLLLSFGAFAYGEVGQWSSGWGQGVTEYTTVDSKKNALYIACSDSAPVSMTLTVSGKEYGTYAKKGFDLIIDGKEVQTPYDTGSRVGANNFLYAWDAIRKAKTLQAKIGEGKVVDLPLKNAAKVLPSTKSKKFTCQVDS